MSDGRFSQRFGHGPVAAEISIRADAPEQVRGALLMLAQGEMRLAPGRIRGALCTVMRMLPDEGNWGEYPNIWNECMGLMRDAPWYRVYDFVEVLYQTLARSADPEKADQWATLVNEYFAEAGVGWQLVNGALQSRGAEAFEAVVADASEALQATDMPTARQEIHEALRDLSRRPEPDVTGAIQHAMAALECTARQAVGDVRPTLGDILRRHPDLFPRPLDEGIAKLWGYASETGRHLREGRLPSRAEAELIVGVSASACTYLVASIRQQRGRGDV